MAGHSTPLWRRAVAAVLDFLTIFLVAGTGIAALTGNLKSSGFEMEGWPALITMAIVVVYFVFGNKYLGGTFWRRLFCK